MLDDGVMEQAAGCRPPVTFRLIGKGFPSAPCHLESLWHIPHNLLLLVLLKFSAQFFFVKNMLINIDTE